MCKTPSARNDVSASGRRGSSEARASLARDGRGSAIRGPTRAQRGGRPSRRDRSAPGRGRLPRGRLSGRFARVRRYRGARRRRDRARVRAQRRAAPPSPRPDGADRDPRRRRADRLGRDLDRLVDRRRSLMGLARTQSRLPRVPRSRAPRGSAVRRGAAPRLAPRGRRRGRDRLGAPRRCDPLAVPGRRSHRAPPRAGRLLERARAAGGRRDRPRPLARERASTGAPRRRGAARVRRGARDAAHPVTVRGRRRRRGRRPLARAEPGAAGGRPAPGRLRRPGARGRRLGLHPTRARRRRRAARRPGLGRPGLRRVDPGHGTRGRARGLEAPDPARSSPSANGS